MNDVRARSTVSPEPSIGRVQAPKKRRPKPLRRNGLTKVMTCSSPRASLWGHCHAGNSARHARPWPRAGSGPAVFPPQVCAGRRTRASRVAAITGRSALPAIPLLQIGPREFVTHFVDVGLVGESFVDAVIDERGRLVEPVAPVPCCEMTAMSACAGSSFNASMISGTTAWPAG